MFTSLLLHQVVIAVLWILTQQYDGVSGAYYNLAETDDEGRPNARLQLLGESFSNITRIFVPFIVLKSHWNLLVCFLFNLIELVAGTDNQLITNAINETGYVIHLR